MAFYPDGIHMRPCSRVPSTYLRADEGGVGALRRPRGVLLNGAWQVGRLVRNALLHSSYGQGHAPFPEEAPQGHHAVQRRRDALESDAVNVRISVRAGDEEGKILLRQVVGNADANPWSIGVSVSDYHNPGAVIHGVDEASHGRPAPQIPGFDQVSCLPEPLPLRSL